MVKRARGDVLARGDPEQHGCELFVCAHDRAYSFLMQNGVVGGVVATQVGRRVKALLNEHGLSIRQASEMTNIPLATLSRKLRGNPINVEDIAVLADALGMSFTELVGYVSAGIGGVADGKERES
ncbi:MAG: helix-turn-helix domain-containing protein [Micrococcales bacterium]|nr:helix-turn-helix domain-containing protein [Micrococcales bacterium]